MRLANLVKVTNNGTNNTVLAQTVINNTYSICGKRIASVPVELMDIDYTYQRIAGTTINKLMRDWNDEKCDFLVVSFRDNKFYIIDGQHRYTVAKAKGIVSLPCIIFTGLTQNDEALKFARQQDNVNKLSAYDTFKANIACGNANIPEVKTDMEIKRICDKYNIEVKKYGRNNVGEKVLRCLTTVRPLVNSTTYDGLKCFEWLIDTVNTTNWADCSDSYSDYIIAMLKNYYVDNVDNLNEDKLMKVMNSITPSELIVKAKYEYSEYGVRIALGLCLRDMIQEVSKTNYGIRVA
jgi:hypothetical protein